MKTGGKRKLVQNTATLLVSNGGSALLSFVLSALIGRAAGLEGLGVYAAALAWIFPLSLAVDFGLSTLLTRDLAQSPHAEAEYLRLATQQRLVMGGAVMVGVILSAATLSQSRTVQQGIVISAPLVLIAPLFGMFTALFRAQRRMWPIALLNLGMLAAQVAATALVFALGCGAAAALAVNTLTSAGQLGAAWALWRALGAADGGAPVHNTLRVLMRRAWPFAVAAVLAALLGRANFVMLERLSGAAETGNYTAALRFVEAARMPPNALFGALLPALAALRQDARMMRRMFGWVLAGLGLYGAIVATLGLWLSAPALAWVYNRSFVVAADTLQWGLWALIPALLRGGFTLYRYAQGEENLVNAVLFVGLMAQLGSGLWLIPKLGAQGAVMASLGAEALMVVLLWRRLWPYRYASGQTDA